MEQAVSRRLQLLLLNTETVKEKINGLQHEAIKANKEKLKQESEGLQQIKIALSQAIQDREVMQEKNRVLEQQRDALLEQIPVLEKQISAGAEQLLNAQNKIEAI